MPTRVVFGRVVDLDSVRPVAKGGKTAKLAMGTRPEKSHQVTGFFCSVFGRGGSFGEGILY